MDLPPPPPQLPPREGGLPYPPTPPLEKSDLPPKGPGSPGIILPRIAARIIDFLITTIPFGILAQPYVKTTGKTQSFDGPAWLVVASLITPLVYEILMTAWHGQTIGKMALRLQVVRYRDGGHVNLQASAIRAIVPVVPTLVAYAVPPLRFIGLGTYLIYLTAVIDPIYRGWGDKAAATIVLRTK